MDAWLIFLMVIWGLHFVVLKSALTIMPPLMYNALRFGIGTIMLGVILKANGQRIMLPRREILALAWVSFLGYALYQAVFTTGLSKTTVANNALIISSTPVWIVLYNALRGHERLTHRLLLAVGLTLGGVAVVILSRYAGELAIGSTTLVGDLLSVVASWIWALVDCRVAWAVAAQPRRAGHILVGSLGNRDAGSGRDPAGSNLRLVNVSPAATPACTILRRLNCIGQHHLEPGRAGAWHGPHRHLRQP